MKKKLVLTLSVLIMVSGIVVLLNSISVFGKEKQEEKPVLKLGIDVLLDQEIGKLKGKHVGLITNPTGVDQELNSIVDTLFNHKDVELIALYGPEHGVRGDAQAGEEVDYYIDEKTGLPVYSLYGETKKPTPEMLEGVDVLVFDIQDVGARFYTYIYTMAYALEAAAENNIEMIVLDRPNPIAGDDVQGPVLDPDYASFVGMYPIPQRHGMTVGELAQLFNEEFNIGANLDVIEMVGWERSLYYDDTPFHWVMPSPNMPTLDTALVYPGTALIEGTNVSEGRGTTKPFELIGAPFIDGDVLANELNQLRLPGVKFRAAYFTPQFSKHAGKLSGGIEVYVTDRENYQAIKTGLAIVKKIHDLYPDDFAFRAEDRNGVSFFDNLVGNGWIREAIEAGVSLDEIEAQWQHELQTFRDLRRNFLIYKLTVKDLMKIVHNFKTDGEIEAEAAHQLELHLIAVARYEEKESSEKVVKHMEGFKLLLEQQLALDLITKKAYNQLMAAGNSFQKQW